MFRVIDYSPQALMLDLMFRVMDNRTPSSPEAGVWFSHGAKMNLVGWNFASRLYKRDSCDAMWNVIRSHGGKAQLSAPWAADLNNTSSLSDVKKIYILCGLMRSHPHAVGHRVHLTTFMLWNGADALPASAARTPSCNERAVLPAVVVICQENTCN